MKTRGVLNSGDTITYALGQIVSTYKGLNRINHGGSDAGYRTNLARFPDQNFSVMVFGNVANFEAGTMAMKIADIYLEDEFTSKNKSPNPRTNSKKSRYPSRKKDVNLQDYVGRFYSEELSTTYTLKIKRKKLVAEHYRQGDINLSHHNKDTLEVRSGFLKKLILSETKLKK